jgi:hypothetical protein
MTAVVDAAETPIAVTVIADNSITSTVGRVRPLRFILMGKRFRVDNFRLFCEQDNTDVQGEAAHREAAFLSKMAEMCLAPIELCFEKVG